MKEAGELLTSRSSVQESVLHKPPKPVSQRFRPEVKEYFCSPAFLLQPHLMDAGVTVSLHDPLYSDAEIEAAGFTPGSLEEGILPEVLILNTAHSVYQSLDFTEYASRGVVAVIDGRNIWNPEDVRNAGMEYIGIGRNG